MIKTQKAFFPLFKLVLLQGCNVCICQTGLLFQLEQEHTIRTLHHELKHWTTNSNTAPRTWTLHRTLKHSTTNLNTAPPTRTLHHQFKYSTTNSNTKLRRNRKNQEKTTISGHNDTLKKLTIGKENSGNRSSADVLLVKKEILSLKFS